MVAKYALLLCAVLATVHLSCATLSLDKQPTTAEPTTSGTTEPPPFECKDEYGLFPDPYDCHAFFECNEYIPFHFVCPDGLAWNDAAHMCDYSTSCK